MTKQEFYEQCICLLSLLIGLSLTRHPNIGTPPSFTMEPPERMIISDMLQSSRSGDQISNLIIPCGVTGTPTPTIKWFREESELTGNFTVANNGTLVAIITYNDTALRTGVPFHCEATNIFGASNSTATIRSRNVSVSYSRSHGGLEPNSGDLSVIRNGTLLIYEPANIISPTDAYVDDRERFVGQRVNYTSAVRGIPTPTVTWYYNGGALPVGANVMGAFKNRLTISDPQVAHSGIYQCFVSNDYGVDSRAWILEVRLPFITVLPLNQSNPSTTNDLLVGTLIIRPFGTINQMIIATLDSDPCPFIQWSLNGTSIVNDTIFSVSNPCADSSAQHPFNFTLTIANLTYATSGNYSATFSHLAGSVTLPLLYVTVPVPVQVLNLVRETEGTLNPPCLLSGSNAILSCEILGWPRPTLMFIKEKDVIIPGAAEFERITSLNFYQIQIRNVTRNDEGSYYCEANNGNMAGNFQAFCTLPRIISIKRSGEAVPLVGKIMILLCEVAGDPTPTVTWHLNGITLADSDRITIASFSEISLVTIIASRLSDSGVYTCVATNDVATVNSTFHLEMATKPRIISITQILMGQNRTLRCLFAGVPPPTVTWLMNGRTLVDSPRIIVSNSSGVSNINIQSFRSSDAGLYTCVITNVAATVNSTFLLEIENPGDSFGLSTKIDYISVIIGIAIAVVVAIAVIILIPVAKKIIKAHKRHKNTGRVAQVSIKMKNMEKRRESPVHHYLAEQITTPSLRL